MYNLYDYSCRQCHVIVSTSYIICTPIATLTVVQSWLWFWCHIYVCLYVFLSLCHLCHYALPALTVTLTVVYIYNMYVACMSLCLYVIVTYVSIYVIALFPSLSV